jgi:hypothetical protein
MLWPEGWRDVTDEEETGLGAQLRRELVPGHVLFGQSFRVIARRDDQDDILLELSGARVAELHLTWAANADAAFPGALVFDDIEDWKAVQV